VHLYGLYLDLFLWDRPHYRAPTYRHDLLAVRTCQYVPAGRTDTGVPCLHMQAAHLSHSIA